MEGGGQSGQGGGRLPLPQPGDELEAVCRVPPAQLLGRRQRPAPAHRRPQLRVVHTSRAAQLQLVQLAGLPLEVQQHGQQLEAEGRAAAGLAGEHEPVLVRAESEREAVAEVPRPRLLCLVLARQQQRALAACTASRWGKVGGNRTLVSEYPAQRANHCTMNPAQRAT